MKDTFYYCLIIVAIVAFLPKYPSSTKVLVNNMVKGIANMANKGPNTSCHAEIYPMSGGVVTCTKWKDIRENREKE